MTLIEVEAGDRKGGNRRGEGIACTREKRVYKTGEGKIVEKTIEIEKERKER